MPRVSSNWPKLLLPQFFKFYPTLPHLFVSLNFVISVVEAASLSNLRSIQQKLFPSLLLLGKVEMASLIYGFKMHIKLSLNLCRVKKATCTEVKRKTVCLK
jgi:hypothetical protein